MLVVKDISFSYDKKVVISSLSFTVTKGKNLAIIGESGCGKSTLLKLVYGLFDLNQGHIFWDDTQILGPKFNLIPGMDFIKYLAQDFDLMPYTTAAENVGDFLSNSYPEQKQKRINELLELVEMSEFADVKVRFLSGGQMQRIALARVLALEPELLLLDEPFSHIDNFRKNSLRRKCFAYFKEKNISCIIATHDSKDVLGFSDEILILQNGQTIQCGSTKQVYKNPKNSYCASLFDDVNEISNQSLGLATDKNQKTILYPYQFTVVSQSDLSVVVSQSFFKGDGYLIEARWDNQLIYFNHHLSLTQDDVVYLNFKNNY